MELDRDFIERRDFAQVRRGYDPEAVDRHLAAIAREADQLRSTIEELERGRSAGPPSLSGAAAEQIRVIVEAAESSAAAIEEQAKGDAERRGQEAERRAGQLSRETERRIESLVVRSDEASDLLLRGVDSIESELSSLREGARALTTALEGLGDRTAPLKSEIQGMRSGIAELRDDPEHALQSMDAGAWADPEPPRDVGAIEPEPVLAAEPPEPRAADEEIVPEATVEPAVLGGDDLRDEELIAPDLAEEPVVLPEAEPLDEPVIAGPGEVTEAELALEEDRELDAELARDEELVVEEPGAEIAAEEATLEEPDGIEPSAPVDGDQDEEGARLVALNMALNGVPREETDRYLADNFALSNRSGVLDDVYARVGGA